MLDLVVMISGMAMIALGCGWMADRKLWVGLSCFLYAALVFVVEVFVFAVKW
ncbi:hypothetical protein GJU93_06020 [Brucella sp. 10RB9212]|uniref:hypothetical protein n=1 Tax=unclassified Brucella TaxID=2632610 RepID=UPI0012AE650C|nr:MULTISPECIES: hypothetical protein [unclassified Brucella]MRN46147.1 hypothetical protein [Brucella sp. 10RB9212]